MAQSKIENQKSKILFFPTLAHQSADAWQIPIHAWLFKPTELSRRRRFALHLVRKILRLPIKRDDPDMPLLRKRLGSFLAKSQSRQRIQIDLLNHSRTLKKSCSNGHSKSILILRACELPPCADPRWLTFHSTPNAVSGKILLVPPIGPSVISDIDDTIKITEVLDRHKMLTNTFLKPFPCVPGMPELFQHLAKTQNAAFHYVSASPWQLYPFLEEFLAIHHFPQGTFHLRDFRLLTKNISHVLRSSASVKARHIRTILNTFPCRAFLLFGDSGQSDPTTYAKFALSHPAQIEKIFIRNVTNDPPESSRWQKTFAQIPPQKFQIFSTPSEITLPS